MLRVLAGAVLISFAAVFVSLSGVAPAPAAFYRLVIGAVALMGFAVLRRERLQLAPRFIVYVLLAGLAFAADLVIWHLSIYRVGPGIATLLPNFQVVLMTLAGWLIWRERLTPRIAVAIGVAVVGLVLLLMAAPQAGHGRFMAGIGYGLGAAVAYTAYLLFLRLAGGSTSRKAPAFFIGSVSVVAAGGYGFVDCAAWREFCRSVRYVVGVARILRTGLPGAGVVVDFDGFAARACSAGRSAVVVTTDVDLCLGSSHFWSSLHSARTCGCGARAHRSLSGPALALRQTPGSGQEVLIEQAVMRVIK